MKYLFYITLTALALTFFSCAKEDANDPNAPITPSTDSREALVGSWNVTENSTTSTTPNAYVVSIAKHGSNSSAIVSRPSKNQFQTLIIRQYFGKPNS